MNAPETPADSLGLFHQRELATTMASEADRIAADLAYQRFKDSGQLRAYEDFRALRAQVQFGDAQ